MRIEGEKTFSSYVNGQFQFSKFRNVQTQNNILKFLLLLFWLYRLLELLSYGEYNHIYISVICFLKTTHLSVIVFSH